MVSIQWTTNLIFLKTWPFTIFCCVLFSFCSKHIDSLRLFWFPRKIAHEHISGRQNKNKLKEEHVESSEQLVNRVPNSLYTSFVSVDFGKSMPVRQHSDVQSKLKVNYFFKILLYTFSEMVSWVKNNKMGHCWKWPAKKINIAQICSAHFATDEPS